MGARGVAAVSAVEQLDAGERRGWLRGPRDSLSGGRTMTRELQRPDKPRKIRSRTDEPRIWAALSWMFWLNSRSHGAKTMCLRRHRIRRWKRHPCCKSFDDLLLDLRGGRNIPIRARCVNQCNARLRTKIVRRESAHEDRAGAQSQCFLRKLSRAMTVAGFALSAPLPSAGFAASALFAPSEFLGNAFGASSLAPADTAGLSAGCSSTC
jgi:hypothetical protein